MPKSLTDKVLLHMGKTRDVIEVNCTQLFVRTIIPIDLI